MATVLPFRSKLAASRKAVEAETSLSDVPCIGCPALSRCRGVCLLPARLAQQKPRPGGPARMIGFKPKPTVPTVAVDDRRECMLCPVVWECCLLLRAGQFKSCEDVTPAPRDTTRGGKSRGSP